MFGQIPIPVSELPIFLNDFSILYKKNLQGDRNLHLQGVDRPWPGRQSLGVASQVTFFGRPGTEITGKITSFRR